MIGLGSIGKGVLKHLNNQGVKPLVSDRDLAIMAELAHGKHQAVTIETLLRSSDVIFLNTGSCFLADNPELLTHLRNDALLVLCTSGDVEAGVPQLIANGDIQLADLQVHDDIASYKTRHDKSIRIMLGNDAVGQAPNMIIEDGSGSLANLMSDMEFYALGCYLGSQICRSPTGCVSESPAEIQNLIIDQWLNVFHPQSTSQPISRDDYKNEAESALLEMPLSAHGHKDGGNDQPDIHIE